MSKWFKNEEGITLIELLASLALLSVVIILIGSVHIFGQKQFSSQTEANSQSNDLRYSLALISREARSAKNLVISETELNIDGNIYILDDTNLKKNNTIISSRVETFDVIELEKDNRIHIIIKSTPNQMNQREEYETTIYLRDPLIGGEAGE
ncbi:hypothetical protein GCM10008932_13210 [Alkalibacterium iburiense]|uniref:Prepilin-type N-terminal cleavage/methylation domain-containing protein n=1 Tax=Alkalibacterium iburiense TaxID=290589 RepID=A0ABN0XE61_9LACT